MTYYLYYLKVTNTYGTKYKVGVTTQPAKRFKSFRIKYLKTIIESKILEEFDDKFIAYQAEAIIRSAYQKHRCETTYEWFNVDVLGEFSDN